MSLNNTDDINLIPFLKTIWNKKKTIVIVTSIFIAVGVVTSLLSPIVYTSSTTFIPSSQEGGASSGLSGVASLVGVSLGSVSSTNKIPASMYPLVGQSIEFKRLLLETYVDDKKAIKMEDFMMNYYKLDSSAYNKTSNPAFVSKSEDKLFKLLEDIVIISVNQKDGFVTISANMSKSNYAANVCINARDILQKIIIDNKIKSAKQNLDYSEKQLDSKRLEFEEVQNKLAYFNDSNLNIVTSSIINQRKRIEAEFEIINAVMIELSKQVEQNKLQVTKDTPIFSIIKEASMPVIRSSPKRKQMVFLYGIFGVVVSVIFVLAKAPVISLYKEVSN